MTKKNSLICLVLAIVLQLTSTTAYAECSFRPFSSYEDNIIGSYIAYYGRPADPDGLDFWSGKLEEAGSLDIIIQAFGESQEFDRRFGSLSNTDLVKNMYIQLFGRTPELEGLNFYVEHLEYHTISLQSASLNILFGAQNKDAIIVNNRKNVAKYYISQLEALNATDLEPSAETLAALIASVTVNIETVNSACASIDALIGVVSAEIEFELYSNIADPRIMQATTPEGDVVTYYGSKTADTFVTAFNAFYITNENNELTRVFLDDQQRPINIIQDNGVTLQYDWTSSTTAKVTLSIGLVKTQVDVDFESEEIGIPALASTDSLTGGSFALVGNSTVEPVALISEGSLTATATNNIVNVNIAQCRTAVKKVNSLELLFQGDGQTHFFPPKSLLSPDGQYQFDNLPEIPKAFSSYPDCVDHANTVLTTACPIVGSILATGGILEIGVGLVCASLASPLAAVPGFGPVAIAAIGTSCTLAVKTAAIPCLAANAFNPGTEGANLNVAKFICEDAVDIASSLFLKDYSITPMATILGVNGVVSGPTIQTLAGGSFRNMNLDFCDITPEAFIQSPGQNEKKCSNKPVSFQTPRPFYPIGADGVDLLEESISWSLRDNSLSSSFTKIGTSSTVSKSLQKGTYNVLLTLQDEFLEDKFITDDTLNNQFEVVDPPEALLLPQDNDKEVFEKDEPITFEATARDSFGDSIKTPVTFIWEDNGIEIRRQTATGEVGSAIVVDNLSVGQHIIKVTPEVDAEQCDGKSSEVAVTITTCGLPSGTYTGMAPFDNFGIVSAPAKVTIIIDENGQLKSFNWEGGVKPDPNPLNFAPFPPFNLTLDSEKKPDESVFLTAFTSSVTTKGRMSCGTNSIGLKFGNILQNNLNVNATNSGPSIINFSLALGGSSINGNAQ